MPTEIMVRGSSNAFHAPERGTVHVSIGYEGSEMQPVYDLVADDLESLRESVLQLTSGDDPAVTWWSADRLRTWSTRPWNDEGIQLPLVHHASIGAQVKFRDFAALSRWIADHVEDTEGFSTSHVEWALTTKRRDELVLQVRTEAVRDAVGRAQQYADALGLGTVSPVAIADAGMLGVSEQPGGNGPMYLDAAPSASGRSNVELVPGDIEVSTTVDARFVASGTIGL